MATLEERRIYKSGKSSVAITLPPGWVRYFNLKPGDKVEIKTDGKLTIRPAVKHEADGNDESNIKRPLE